MIHRTFGTRKTSFPTSRTEPFAMTRTEFGTGVGSRRVFPIRTEPFTAARPPTLLFTGETGFRTRRQAFSALRAKPFTRALTVLSFAPQTFLATRTAIPAFTSPFCFHLRAELPISTRAKRFATRTHPFFPARTKALTGTCPLVTPTTGRQAFRSARTEVLLSFRAHPFFMTRTIESFTRTPSATTFAIELRSPLRILSPSRAPESFTVPRTKALSAFGTKPFTATRSPRALFLAAPTFSAPSAPTPAFPVPAHFRTRPHLAPVARTKRFTARHRFLPARRHPFRSTWPETFMPSRTHAFFPARTIKAFVRTEAKPAMLTRPQAFSAFGPKPFTATRSPGALFLTTQTFSTPWPEIPAFPPGAIKLRPALRALRPRFTSESFPVTRAPVFPAPSRFRTGGGIAPPVEIQHVPTRPEPFRPFRTHAFFPVRTESIVMSPAKPVAPARPHSFSTPRPKTVASITIRLRLTTRALPTLTSRAVRSRIPSGALRTRFRSSAYKCGRQGGRPQTQNRHSIFEWTSHDRVSFRTLSLEALRHPCFSDVSYCMGCANSQTPENQPFMRKGPPPPLQIGANRSSFLRSSCASGETGTGEKRQAIHEGDDGNPPRCL